jgi:tetratricopeptide (TPR) repeat protein
MSRVLLAAVLFFFLGAEAARADDDFKTCASGPSDYAIMACTNMIEGGKLDTRCHRLRQSCCGAFRNRGGLNRALADLNRAVELDAEQAPIYANRGLVYQLRDEPENAVADFNRALELDPNNAVFLLNRGTVYLSMKDKDHALADYDRAIELNPSHAAGYNSRGSLYLSEGDIDRALFDYDRAIELHRDRPRLWLGGPRQT